MKARREVKAMKEAQDGKDDTAPEETGENATAEDAEKPEVDIGNILCLLYLNEINVVMQWLI